MKAQNRKKWKQECHKSVVILIIKQPSITQYRCLTTLMEHIVSISHMLTNKLDTFLLKAVKL